MSFYGSVSAVPWSWFMVPTLDFMLLSILSADGFSGRVITGMCALCCGMCALCLTLQWGAVDTDIKVPSGENTELKHAPFKAWSRSVYILTCYVYCQGFLPCLFLHFRSIHLHFFFKTSSDFSCVGVANTWFLCRPTE